MNNKLISLIALAAGAAVGSLITWKFLKTKYEQIAQDEIDSVKEAYGIRNYTPIGETVSTSDICTAPAEMPDIQEYASKVLDLGYKKEEEDTEEEEVLDNMTLRSTPYIISPSEFDTLDDHEAITLTHYSDGVLTDEWDEPIDEDEVKYLVGKDYASHFGEYEQDAVYVRNDQTKGDYEILRDQRNYEDVHNLSK